MRARMAAAVAAAAVMAAGCGAAAAGGSGPPAGPSVSGVNAPAAKTAAEPVTKAAARSAAKAYFALYGAGQYAAVYPMIVPSSRRYISKSVWVRLHVACKNPASAGLTYRVTHPVLAGRVAVVSVGFAGAASALGSEQQTFTYVSGKWYYKPDDLYVYKGHDLAQAIGAAKQNGFC